MTWCVHRAMSSGENVVCTNHEKMFHSGILPIKFCEQECPYRREPDFFAQTEVLLTRKQRTGEYKPIARACGDCGTVKRRTDKPHQFIWPYWSGGDVADEIRWSVRSVETFFDGNAKCTIIGDKPPWYTGHYIPKPRVSSETTNRAFRDMLSKMWVMATHPEIQEDFTWMMDDIYFIKDFSIDELKVPRAFPWAENKSRNSWQQRKSNTMRALRDKGRANLDYATHAPHHCEKAKLRALFEEFDLHTNTMLWEVLYGNTFRARPVHPSPWFGRIVKPMDLAHIRDLVEPCTVINNISAAFNGPLREFLNSLMPEPCQLEGEAPPASPPKFRVTRKARRKVKRRV